MNLAENLRTEYRSRIEGVALVGQVKESLAVNLKIAFESEAVAIPRTRALTAQIHSIKKTPTEAGGATDRVDLPSPRQRRGPTDCSSRESFRIGQRVADPATGCGHAESLPT